MNKTLNVIGATVLMVTIAVGCTAEEAVVKLDDGKQRISYTIGLNIGRDFVSQEIEIDTAALVAGVRESLHALVQAALGLLAVALLAAGVGDAALGAEEGGRRGHDGDEEELRVPPVGDLPAIEKGLLARLGAVVGEQDPLVHGCLRRVREP